MTVSGLITINVKFENNFEKIYILKKYSAVEYIAIL